MGTYARGTLGNSPSCIHTEPTYTHTQVGAVQDHTEIPVPELN